MRLTVLVNPQTRTATFREVSFLAAGDECELLLHGVSGADTASLALVLYRDATLESPVAAVPAGSFSDVPNHGDDRAATLSLSTPEMEAWFLSAALRAQESESSESGQAGESAESAVRALGWLVVSDASRTWVAMRVPVLLRSFTPSGSPVDGSTVAASVMAAVREALAGKADAVPGKGLSSNDFTDALLARLESVSAGAEPNVQADWAVEASSDDAFIKNRPSIPPAPVQADWGCEDSSDPSFVRRKPDLSGIGARPRPDWLAESSADDGIVHKPDLSAFARVDSLPRADWAETDPSSPSYVANKPARAVPDWDESDSADPSFIRNRPDLSRFVRLSSFPQADWSEDDEAKPSYVRNRPRRVRPDWLAAESDAAGILNKPGIPPPQEQADWEETSVGSPSYVRHKPQVDQAVSAASPSANAASSKAVADYVAAAVSGLQAAIPGWRLAYWDAKQDALSAARMARWDAAAYASSASAGPWPMVPAEFSGTSLSVSPSECALAAWPSGASSVSVSVLPAGESSDSSDSSSDSGLPPSRRLIVALDCSGAEGPLSVSWPAGSLPASSDASPGTVNVWRLDEFAAGRFAVHRLHPPAKEQVQADWEEEDSSDPSFIRNRPYVPPVLSDVDLCSSEDMWPEGVPSVGLVAGHLAHRRSLADLAAYAEAGPSWQLVSGLPEGYSAPDGPYDDGYAGDGVNDVWKIYLGPGGETSLGAIAPADASELVFQGYVDNEPVSVTYRRLPGGFSPTGDRLALRSEVAQADWGESDSSDPSFVRNRPDLSLKRDVHDLSYPGAYAGWTETARPGGVPVSAVPFARDAASGKWTRPAYETGGHLAAVAVWYGDGKWRVGCDDGTVFDSAAAQEDALSFAPASFPGWTFARPSVYSAPPGTLALRSDLAQADWDESSSGDPSFIRNRPTIPDPVSVDATLAVQGAAADAKAVGDALRGGFTEWEFDGLAPLVADSFTHANGVWSLVAHDSVDTYTFYGEGTADATSVTVMAGSEPICIATRRLITPTKTSQLTNDGDGTNAFVKTNDTRLSDARTPTAHTHAMADVTGLNAALAQKATASDLPYRLVEPGKWEFSGLPEGVTGTDMIYNNGLWTLYLVYGDETDSDSTTGSEDDLVVVFSYITAARASLPGHLLDRAGNRVVVSGDTTLTLPAANPGYLRDFLVRLEISGSTVPTITFAAPTGETITYETDGDEFPVPDEAGDWLYSFTESCVAHTFAVALKKVNVVAQGGS